MASMIDRVIRAVKLDKDFYNEAERDTSLNQEALLIVIIVSLASAIGSFISGIISGEIGGALLSAVLTIVIGIGGYYLWAYVTLFVGKQFFQGDADMGEMLRTLGYAHAPRLLGLLSFIPCVGAIFALAGFVLSLIAAVIAIREAMDFDTGKAVITAIIGWAIVLVISIVIGVVLGVGAAGVGGVMSALRG
jgi:hypothetical protein